MDLYPTNETTTTRVRFTLEWSHDGTQWHALGLRPAHTLDQLRTNWRRFVAEVQRGHHEGWDAPPAHVRVVQQVSQWTRLPAEQFTF
jgi:hypothetical protein